LPSEIREDLEEDEAHQEALEGAEERKNPQARPGFKEQTGQKIKEGRLGMEVEKAFQELVFQEFSIKKLPVPGEALELAAKAD